MKFNEFPYKRPDAEALCGEYERLAEKVRAAASPAALFDAVAEHERIGGAFDTMGALANARHTIDTSDPFYEAERAFFDNAGPLVSEASQKLFLALYESPYRGALEEKYGSLLFKNIELSLRSFSPVIVPLLQEENTLTAEYQKLTASAKIEFDGKTLNLAGLGPYKVGADRGVRRDAYFAEGNWYSSVAADLDRIFDDLVRVRSEMAAKMGRKNFISLGYDRFGRNCWGPEDVDVFRAGIREHAVPLVSRLKSLQAKRLGLTPADMRFWDDAVSFAEGNPKPQGSYDDIMAAGRKMYREMSEKTGEFIDMMFERELFDVVAKPNKAVGGYCTYFADYKSPFIFSNFNGTSGDVDVLTHEAGHAYAAWLCSDFELLEQMSPTAEACEVHSMSMEFLCWPWLSGFYGDDTPRARFAHLESGLVFLPYGTMVDHFQHIVYENPTLTPAQRNEKWAELERTYRPWINFADTPFYSEGRGWQRQLHIYLYPFYYIDYCLAQTSALDVWRLSQTDYAEAQRRYNIFASLGGKKTYTELCAVSGIADPMKPGALAEITSCANDWLDKNC